MWAWDGRVASAEEYAETRCRAACAGPKDCACQCHDAGDRVAALLRERFGNVEADLPKVIA